MCACLGCGVSFVEEMGVRFAEPENAESFLFRRVEREGRTRDALEGMFRDCNCRRVRAPLFRRLGLFAAGSKRRVMGRLCGFGSGSSERLALEPRVATPITELCLGRLRGATAGPVGLFCCKDYFECREPRGKEFERF